MDFKKLFINMAVVALITLAIFSFIITTQTDNNTGNLITNNSIINNSYGNLYNNLSGYQTDANSISSEFGIVPPSSSFGIVDVGSVVSTTSVFRSLTVGTYNILVALPIKILGVPPLVTGLISAIFVLLIILGIWAIWRGVVS